MRDWSWRCLALALALAVFSAACGDDTETTSPDPVATSEGSEPDGHQHSHGVAMREAVEPYPSVSVRILEDPSGGWLIHSAPANFRMAPENVSSEHIDGEGHMHLYIDGVKITRLYGDWHQMPPLTAGIHEIRVELSSNDHSTMAIDGTIVDDTVTLEVSAAEATLVVEDSMSEMGSSEHDMSEMDSDDDSSTDETDASPAIVVEIVGGEPVGGHQRVSVDLNSEVAVMLTSDTAEEVHVHGYDILHAVTPGEPLHFSFAAEIPGVFEVELEGSGRLLLVLTVS